ncbi:thymidine phosphorylase [Pandoraea sp.]|nr:thymidine phosphorylase [Pandoraea sp.]TAL55803.1 MAG: thymidine phosphorylase [Pandoraea sp.]TAM15687.1 MAG: thymidine phosphorylase [Pandoraea sp.]
MNDPDQCIAIPGAAPLPGPNAGSHRLPVRLLGIDTDREAVVYMRREAIVCQAEGFAAQTRVAVSSGARRIAARLRLVSGHWLEENTVGLSCRARDLLAVDEGDWVELEHLPAVESFDPVRAKLTGQPFADGQLAEIMHDVASGRYADIHIASLLSACAGGRMEVGEIIALTLAMAQTGQRLQWPTPVVLDKYRIGGMAGNCTTPIIVAIVSAHGLTMPKTSSRAITSPAGTADTMETMAPVDLDLARMRRVVDEVGGCVVWSDTVGLCPADDALIDVERSLELSSDARWIASILSKALAGGGTHVVVDVPVGQAAEIRSRDMAVRLIAQLGAVGGALGIQVFPQIADGSQPAGRGLGPALEARDVLSVLQGAPDAPVDLTDRAVAIAGTLLELGGRAVVGAGAGLARKTLNAGLAWQQFQRICDAQGGMREPRCGRYSRTVSAARAGRVSHIDNRCLNRIAKAAGAPAAPGAGMTFVAPLGTLVAPGDPLFTIYAQSAGELSYALAYAQQHPQVIAIEAA